MSEPRRNPVAAGAPLALATCAGTLIGAAFGEPSIGVVAGVGVGAAGAIALWLADRRRVGR